MASAGFDGKIYYHATAETANPTDVHASATLITGVRDMSLDNSVTMVDVASRDNRNAFKRAGLIDRTITIQMLEDDGNTTLSAFKTAETGTAFALYFCSAAENADGVCIGGNFIVESIGQSYPLDGEMVVDITFKPHSFVARFTTSAA